VKVLDINFSVLVIVTKRSQTSDDGKDPTPKMSCTSNMPQTMDNT
jgi:hypothetical protein